MKPVKMNCLGDSITYGYLNEQGDAMEKSYPILLKECIKYFMQRIKREISKSIFVFYDTFAL